MTLHILVALKMLVTANQTAQYHITVGHEIPNKHVASREKGQKVRGVGFNFHALVT